MEKDRKKKGYGIGMGLEGREKLQVIGMGREGNGTGCPRDIEKGEDWIGGKRGEEEGIKKREKMG